MSPACCQSCLVRFTAASAASVEACPRCGQALDHVAAAREVLGYQLLEPAPHELPAAAEAALPAPEPGDSMTKKDTVRPSGDAAWQATKQRIAKSNEQAYARGRAARAAAAALVDERRRAADKRETASLRAHREARMPTP